MSEPTDLMSIGIAMDTTDVDRGEKVMERLGATTEATGRKVAVSNGQMGQFNVTMNTAATAAERAAKAKQADADAMERERRAAEQLSIAQAELIDRVDALAAKHGKSSLEMLKADAATLGLTEKLKGQFEVLDTVVKKTDAHGFSLQSSVAKIELARIAHDGMIGSYQRMASSAFVFANASGLSALAFSAIGASIAGVVVVAGALAYEMYQGRKEVEEMKKALDLTNGAVGMTTDQMRLLVEQMDTAHGSTAAATEAMTLMAASGVVAGTNLKAAAQAAVYMAKDSGKSIEEVAKDIEKMSDGAAKWAMEYQKQHHFMDATTMQTVIELDKEGKQIDATAVTLKALADEHGRFAKRVQEEMGYVQRTWRDVAGAFDYLKEAVKGWGAGATKAQQLIQMNADLKNLEEGRAEAVAAKNMEVVATYDKLLGAKRADISATKEQIAAAAPKAAPGGAGGDAVVAQTRYMEDMKYASKAQRLKQETDLENKAFEETKAKLVAGHLSTEALEKTHQERLAEIKKRATDTPKKAPSTYGIAEKGEMDATAREMAFEAEAIRAKTQMNDFMYKHNMESAEDYYRKEHDLQVEQETFNMNALTYKIEVANRLVPLDDAARLRKQNELRQLGDQLALQEQVSKNRQAYDAQQEAVLPREREYAALVKEAAQLKKQEAQQLNEISALEAAYKLDVVDGGKAKNAAMAEYAAKLQVVLDKMRELSGANPFLKGAGNKEGDVAAEIAKASEGAKGTATKDPWFAMRESMNRYAESAKQDGMAIGAAMDNAFRGAEDAFLSFTQTGKLSFSSMATSILADLERIFVKKAILGLVNMAVGAFTGGGSAPGTSGIDTAGWQTVGPGRASGGPVKAGTTYLVGENGPEKVTMGGDGFVTPNGGGQGNGSMSVSVVINAQTGESKTSTGGQSTDSLKAFGEMLGGKVREIILQEKRNGGLLA